jgi:hypothetical protein
VHSLTIRIRHARLGVTKYQLALHGRTHSLGTNHKPLYSNQRIGNQDMVNPDLYLRSRPASFCLISHPMLRVMTLESARDGSLGWLSSGLRTATARCRLPMLKDLGVHSARPFCLSSEYGGIDTSSQDFVVCCFPTRHHRSEIQTPIAAKGAGKVKGSKSIRKFIS